MERFDSFKEKIGAGIQRTPDFGPIELYLGDRTVRSKDQTKSVRLNPQQYQILWLLVRAQGNILSNAEISNFIYEDLPEDKDIPMYDLVQIRIGNLRKILREVSGEEVSIENVRGLGFHLVWSGDSRGQLMEKLDPGINRPPTFGPLSLDLESRTFSIDGKNSTRPLTPQQYQVLWLLVRAQGKTISQDEIVDFLYRGEGKDAPGETLVHTLISRVREELEFIAGNKVQIKNERDQGYYLEVSS